MKFIYYWAIALLAGFPGRAIAQSFSDTLFKPYYGAYESLSIPELKGTTYDKVITVAIIDDGFNVKHRGIKDYIYKNAKEIPGNEVDDDANGYIDDINGWDAADNDNNITIPAGRESFFYHGTMVAGAIVIVAERCFGPKASQYIKILPVKVLGDKSQKTYYEQAYEGIDYAVRAHADIIVCAWNGGKYDKEKYHGIFEEAAKRGVLILASAGNFYSEQCDPPASIFTVNVVAALDSNFKKLGPSNYGIKVDLSAPGDFVYAPHPLKDNGYGYNDGSSAAVSLVAGCAAVLKALKPEANADELMAALKNTAIPIDTLNRYYAGKLGSGRVNLTAAAQYLQAKTGRDSFFNPLRPEGEIVLDKPSSKTSWNITPVGGFRGFTFSIKGKWNAANSPIKFYTADSLVTSYAPVNFPGSVFIKGNSTRVEFSGKKGAKPSIITYSSSPVDSTILYCSNTRYYENPEDEITDGSGINEYANNCSCKWQISVAQGKRVKIIFDELDTQPNVDFVWLFNGTGTLQENLLAKFSGNKLPPIIVSSTNKLLLWFVTDKEITGQGWHLNYYATDEPMGVIEPVKH